MLNQLILQESSRAILDNAQKLVYCIDNEEFAELDLTVGNGLTMMSRQDAASYASELIRSGPERFLLIAYSNADVSSLNEWARRQRFAQNAPIYAMPGDLIEIYSFVNSENPLEDVGPVLAPGDLIAALLRLYRENAAALTPDPLWSAFHDSHPAAAERIEHLRRIERGEVATPV